MRLGYSLQEFEVQMARAGDNLIDRDVIPLWNDERRIIRAQEFASATLAPTQA